MKATSSPSIETFRDPAGSLRVENGRVTRRVRAKYAGATLDFLHSDLARRWVEDGRLIGTSWPARAEDARHSDSEVLLEHPRVFFPSYPWEWTPSAWIAAGNLTLDLCESLLTKGLILKDATPLNVLFEGTKPVFVDVLSIERRDSRSPLWIAYAQFVRTFLLPLVAYRYLGWPLAASLQRRDGYEPADLYPHLGVLQRWSRPFRSLITLPYLLDQRGKSRGASTPASIRQSPEIATAVLRRNLRSLRTLLNSLAPAKSESRWSGYPEGADHYSEADHERKRDFVKRALTIAKPESVLDLGANTGIYSRIGAESGARVVAWDTDLAATERNWAQCREQDLSVQPLLVDPARPTPSVGWRNSEYPGLLDRAAGNFDCVLALGLMHHLLIADQIPLAKIAALLRDLTTEWLVVEWIPPTDRRFAELVRGRDELYGHLGEDDFLLAMQRHFSTAIRETLPNGRALFLLQVETTHG